MATASRGGTRPRCVLSLLQIYDYLLNKVRFAQQASNGTDQSTRDRHAHSVDSPCATSSSPTISLKSPATAERLSRSAAVCSNSGTHARASAVSLSVSRVRARHPDQVSLTAIFLSSFSSETSHPPPRGHAILQVRDSSPLPRGPCRSSASTRLCQPLRPASPLTLDQRSLHLRNLPRQHPASPSSDQQHRHLPLRQGSLCILGVPRHAQRPACVQRENRARPHTDAGPDEHTLRLRSRVSLPIQHTARPWLLALALRVHRFVHFPRTGDRANFDPLFFHLTLVMIAIDHPHRYCTLHDRPRHRARSFLSIPFRTSLHIVARLINLARRHSRNPLFCGISIHQWEQQLASAVAHVVCRRLQLLQCF